MAVTERNLILLRHAKAAWPNVPDRERPLADVGRHNAPLAGAWLRDHDLIPDLVLCSPAQRTKETWELVANQFDQVPKVHYESGIYPTNADRLLDIVRDVQDDPKTVLVVAHNPGIRDFTLLLTDDIYDPKPPESLLRLRGGFPTSAIAVATFPRHWSQLGPGAAHLAEFAIPR